MNKLVAALFGLLLAACSAPSHAAASLQADDPLAHAHELWLTGRYAEAAEAFAALAEDDAEPAAVAIGLARCSLSEGDSDAALQTLQQALDDAADLPPESRAALWAQLAAVQFDRGRWDEAREACEQAMDLEPSNVRAHWVEARLSAATGDYETANAQFEWFVHHYNANQRAIEDPEELRIIGLAVAEYARWNRVADQFSIILDLYADAQALDPNYWQADYESGRLYLEKYKRGDATRHFRAALAINPDAAEVHAAIGRGAFQDFRMDEARTSCDRALEINPNLLGALTLRADLHLADSQLDDARRVLERAAEINATDEEVLGRLAACYLLEDDAGELQRVLEAGLEALVPEMDENGEDAANGRNQPADDPNGSRFRRLLAELVGRNPRPGVFFYTLGGTLEDRRHFDAAEQAYLAAIELMPQLMGPRNSLGMLSMRVGRVDEGRALLEEAFEQDPFNVRTSNMLRVLDLLGEEYETIETEHFVIVLDAEQDALLGRYMARYLEEQYPLLVEQFGYEPPQRTRFEIFSNGRGLSGHDWFSARTIGLPWIPTVGASTGMLVAMASPGSVRTPFNWAQVLKHEFVHVITLQQTNFNIPTWFTEALAVLNEGTPRPQLWNQLLVERVPDELHDLDGIDINFVRPENQLDRQLAYCQAELYAEFMIERFGQETIADMLDAYREGLSTEEAIRRVFAMSKEEFESAYVEYVQGVVAGLRTRPREEEMSFAELERAHRSNPEDDDIAARLAVEHLRRRDYPRARELAREVLRRTEHHARASYVMASLENLVGDREAALQYLEPAFDSEDPDELVLELLAQIRLEQEDYEAAARLYERAREQDPYNVRWVRDLARTHLLSGDDEALAPVLAELAMLEPDSAAVRKRLAELATARQDYEDAARWAEMTLHITVSDPEVHAIYGEACLALRRYDRAIEEYEAALELDAGANEYELGLARALQGAGRLDEARAHAEAVVERDPDHRRAAELLESLDAGPNDPNGADGEGPTAGSP